MAPKIGGGVKKGESLEQTVRREAKEETGLDVTAVKQIAFRVHPKTGKSIYYFYCTSKSAEAKIDPELNDDFSELLWVTKAELPTYMPTINPDVQELFGENGT